jgi:hypothetical protein
MAKRHPIFKLNQILCAICCALTCSQVYAAANVCATASIVNPNIDGGMGGTGAPAKGGLGGTGTVANGGLGGTGITEEGGFGGTGMTADGGLGGTGVTADGGMGGTGVFAESGLLPEKGKGGVAIVGVVTGFASICVNDTEVHYEASTPVYDNGYASKLSNLTAGQMVMLTADKVDGLLVARSIGMIDAVVGPIDKIDFKLMQVEVMGQTIQVDEATIQQLRTLEQGAVVRVSGHRLANGRIAATRVGIANKKALASTYGIVTNVASDSFAVNGTKVAINNKNVLDKIKIGSEIQVGGAWNGNAIKPNRIVPQPVKNVMNRVDTAIVEGFVGLEGVNGISLAGADVLIPQVKASYRSITNSTGRVVKMEVRRDAAGKWVCDKVEERQGELFDKYNHSKGSNRGRGSSGNDKDDDNKGKKASNVNSSAADSDNGTTVPSANSGSGSGADVLNEPSGLSLPDDNGSGFGTPSLPVRKSNSGSGSSGSGSSGSGSGSSGSGSSGSGSGSSGSGSSGSGSSGSGSSGSGSSGSGSSGSGSSGSSSAPVIVIPKPVTSSGSSGSGSGSGSSGSGSSGSGSSGSGSSGSGSSGSGSGKTK